MNDISEIKRHLDMLPGMLDKCHKTFVPQVLSLTNDRLHPSSITIAFVEAHQFGLRFEMQIDIDGWDLYGLKELLKRLECLCSWEPTDPKMQGFELNGYTFTMGDGDDTGAVYMNKGKLCVWVRAFPTE